MTSPDDSANVPAGHGWQDALEAARTAVLQKPMGQSSQVEAPGAEENLPGWQAMQASDVTAPADGEKVPGSHAVQLAAEVAPDAEEYLPAGQAAQAPPSSAYVPG